MKLDPSIEALLRMRIEGAKTNEGKAMEQWYSATTEEGREDAYRMYQIANAQHSVLSNLLLEIEGL
jgi:hypothetical protein